MKIALLTAIIFITAEFIVYGSITTGWGSLALLCCSFMVSLFIGVLQYLVIQAKESEEYRKSLINRNKNWYENDFKN